MSRFLVGILTLCCISLPPCALAATSLLWSPAATNPAKAFCSAAPFTFCGKRTSPARGIYHRPEPCEPAGARKRHLPEQQAQLGARMATLSQLEAGKTLAELLSPAVWQRLSAYCHKAKLPLEQLQQSKPFFLSMMLTVTYLQRLGFVPGWIITWTNRPAKRANPLASWNPPRKSSP